MTSGEEIKQKLGLNKFKYVSMSRIVVGVHPTYVVYYNSLHPQLPILWNKVKREPFPVMVYRGSDIASNKKPRMLPLVDIEDFDGTYSHYVFVAVDLASSWRIDSRMYENTNKFTNKFTCYTFDDNKNVISEEVFLSDLKKFGMSALTQAFRKERNKLGKSENKTAKLINCMIVNKDVMFNFLTESTFDNKEKFPKKYTQTKEVDPNSNFKLKQNRSKTYLLQIGIVDFMDWLDTYPDKKEVTTKDLKEILNISAIKVWSSDPSFHWQGMNYNMSQLDGSLHPTNIKPKVWNIRHGGDTEMFLSKHLGGLLNQISFFINPITSMLNKKLKDEGYLE